MTVRPGSRMEPFACHEKPTQPHQLGCALHCPALRRGPSPMCLTRFPVSVRSIQRLAQRDRVEMLIQCSRGGRICITELGSFTGSVGQFLEGFPPELTVSFVTGVATMVVRARQSKSLLGARGRALCHGFSEDRGRDGRRRPPPAQIRTGTSNSYGSCLESGAESNTGKRVDRLRRGQVACDDPHETTPWHPVTLASTTKLSKSELLHLVEKLRHPFQVTGDGVIIQPSLTDASQPFSHRLNRPVTPPD